MKISPIVQSVKKVISSPKFADFTENTMYAVTIETVLKMTGRPTFIWLDKEADTKEKKKYASVKEFLYQATCLALYWCMVPYVKKGLYKLISKWLRNKNTINEGKLNLYNTAENSIEEAKKAKNTELWRKLKTDLKNNIKTDSRYHLGKGAHEFSAIVGSVLALAILAPQLSHYIVHPMMKALGFDKETGGNKKVDLANRQKPTF
ncbi:MAG: hypothetical protein WCY19_06115 [Candidatus Gastranaerophilaceae bacterium]